MRDHGDPIATSELATLLDLPGAHVRGAISQMSRAGLIRRGDTGTWLLSLRENGAESGPGEVARGSVEDRGPDSV